MRKYFYNLFPLEKNVNIVDLGNLKLGATVEDTYTVLADVLAELFRLRIIPIIIGGSQDITFANYRGYENIGQIINTFCIDSKIDIGVDAYKFNSKLI